MKTIAVSKKLLQDLENKPLDPQYVEPALRRHMQLVDIPDTDDLTAHIPGMMELSLYLLLFRNTPQGREVAVLSNTTNELQRNFHGEWFSLDDSDWDSFIKHSNFDITYMFNIAVRAILNENFPNQASTDLHMTHSYGMVSLLEPKEGEGETILYAAIAVEIPLGIELPFEWRRVDPGFPEIDLNTLPHVGGSNAQGAGTH